MLFSFLNVHCCPILEAEWIHEARRPWLHYCIARAYVVLDTVLIDIRRLLVLSEVEIHPDFAESLRARLRIRVSLTLRIHLMLTRLVLAWQLSAVILRFGAGNSHLLPALHPGIDQLSLHLLLDTSTLGFRKKSQARFIVHLDLVCRVPLSSDGQMWVDGHHIDFIRVEFELN